MTSRFFGSITALVTPFHNGAFDESAFRAFVNWQIEQGTNGLVPVGTTGESPTLSHGEHKKVVEACIEETKGRVPVIAGAGSNSTSEAVDFAVHAEKAGADAVLVVTPYYNKPTQEGLYQHYKAINNAIGIPIFLYNIPGRSVIDLSIDTMQRLYELDNIVGIKDATGSLARISQQRQVLGADFIQLCGDDIMSLGCNAQGTQGCISVASNVAPKLCSQLQAASLKGQQQEALLMMDRLLPLYHALFLETNPSPAKYALSRLNIMQADVRLPMVPVSAGVKAKMDEALRFAGLV